MQDCDAASRNVDLPLGKGASDFIDAITGQVKTPEPTLPEINIPGETSKDENTNDNIQPQYSKDYGKIIGGITIICLTDLTLGILTAAAFALGGPGAGEAMVAIDEYVGAPVDAIGAAMIVDGSGGWSFFDWVHGLFHK